MKVCVIQPYYSVDFTDADQCFEDELALLEQCDESMDLIVLPEMSDMPSLAKTLDQRMACRERYTDRLLEKVKETAIRCNAMIFVNANYHNGVGYRNTTYAFDRQGNITGHYFKEHLTPGEGIMPERDSEYSFEYTKPVIVEMEGLRFGFMTCYDFYFYEYFSVMAHQNIDILIGCSHQRSDTHDALETMSKFAAYNTNSYMIRSSVSMGEDSPLGGQSMIVAPTGKVLTKMESRIGMAVAEIDPKDKYYKPAGFGNPPAAHYEYVEAGRRPWKYRPGGSFIVKTDVVMNYPRVCAHRGFSAVAPENSLPAFGAAIALGADEIEFDLWPTADGEIVSIHDKTLERVSDGEGNVWEKTLEELEALDFGVKAGDSYKGMKILKFEDILKKFSCHAVMNIHLKTPSNDFDYDPEAMKKIIDLIRQYDCDKYVYFMSGNNKVLAMLQEMAPDLPRCVGAGDQPLALVERALKYGCKKIQIAKELHRGKPNHFVLTKGQIQTMINEAHEHGIVCNMFWSDDPEETKEFLDMGIDTILTNEFLQVEQVARPYKKYKMM
ncbi:MAG: hypothetical protein J6S45_00250 [Firmicutes bacterium]|nr:hypothetical protein [Bacillota bacterium]